MKPTEWTTFDWFWFFQRRGAGAMLTNFFLPNAMLIGGRHLNGAAFIRLNMVIGKSEKMG